MPNSTGLDLQGQKEGRRRKVSLHEFQNVYKLLTYIEMLDMREIAAEDINFGTETSIILWHA